MCESLADRIILGCFLVLLGGFLGGVVGAFVGAATAGGELLNEFATETGVAIGAVTTTVGTLAVWIVRRVRQE